MEMPRSIRPVGTQQRAQRFAELASLVASLNDDEIAILRFLVSNDKPGNDESVPSTSEMPVISYPEPDKKIYESGMGKLEIAVRNTISDMAYFTVPEIVKRLEASEGFSFAAKSPLAAVNQVIRKLKESGEVEEIKAGAGRKPANIGIWLLSKAASFLWSVEL